MLLCNVSTLSNSKHAKDSSLFNLDLGIYWSLCGCLSGRKQKLCEIFDIKIHIYPKILNLFQKLLQPYSLLP